jgi:hypothetical protein
MSIWDELDAEKEAEIAAFRAAEAAKTPEQKEAERIAAENRAQAAHDEGVRLGWWDEEGNSLAVETDDEDEEEDEDDE